MTQEKVAAELGLSKGAVGNWESDTNPPGSDTLRKLAVLLRTTEDYLSGKTDEIEIKEAISSRFEVLPMFGHLEISTLESSLIDLSRKLPKASAADRKHILGNIRAMLDELDERELKPKTSFSPRLSEDQEILRREGEKDDAHQKPPPSHK